MWISVMAKLMKYSVGSVGLYYHEKHKNKTNKTMYCTQLTRNGAFGTGAEWGEKQEEEVTQCRWGKWATARNLKVGRKWEQGGTKIKVNIKNVDYLLQKSRILFSFHMRMGVQMGCYVLIAFVGKYILNIYINRKNNPEGFL